MRRRTRRSRMKRRRRRELIEVLHKWVRETFVRQKVREKMT